MIIEQPNKDQIPYVRGSMSGVKDVETAAMSPRELTLKKDFDSYKDDVDSKFNALQERTMKSVEYSERIANHLPSTVKTQVDNATSKVTQMVKDQFSSIGN